MKEIINQFVEQRYDSGLNTVYARFHKFTPFDDFLPILENSYVLARETKSKKMLINIKQLSVHDVQTTEYINNVWFPTVAKLGVKYVAFVVPASSIGKMSTRSAHKSAETIVGISVNNFYDETEARDWLLSFR